MTLIVEDGTGLSTSESFISVANADARIAALGLSSTEWTALDATGKEQALRRATSHLEGLYRDRWKGTRLLRTQALSWPRYGAVVDEWQIESTLVPTDIANACAELAFKAAAGDLAPDIERAVIREKVGPLETEYSATAPQATNYRAISLKVAPYLRGSGTRLVRA